MADRPREMRRGFTVMHADDGVLVHRKVPCPEIGCGCNYGSEGIFLLSPDKADELADELKRNARYVRSRHT